LLKGSLDIKCKSDLPKIAQSAGERVETLKLFFFNEHLTDKDIKDIAVLVKGLGHVHKIHADFGK
jgi:hypothetical protein